MPLLQNIAQKLQTANIFKVCDKNKVLRFVYFIPPAPTAAGFEPSTSEL
jgi:hypothetical protein